MQAFFLKETLEYRDLKQSWLDVNWRYKKTPTSLFFVFSFFPHESVLCIAL